MKFSFSLNYIFKVTNCHWHTFFSSSSLKHDTCPVCRKSLNGDDSSTQSSSEPSSLNTDPRTPERWSFWNTRTHVRPSHPSSVLTQAYLSLFLFFVYSLCSSHHAGVFLLWFVYFCSLTPSFSVVSILMFLCLSDVFDLLQSFPHKISPSLPFPFFLPQVNKQTVQDERRVGHILLL